MLDVPTKFALAAVFYFTLVGVYPLATLIAQGMLLRAMYRLAVDKKQSKG